MAKVLFHPDEAQINNAMLQGPFTAADLSKTLNMDEDVAARILEMHLGTNLDATLWAT